MHSIETIKSMNAPSTANIVNGIDITQPIFTNMIKKGMKIKSNQLGTPCLGIMADNMKGNTRLVDVKGEELGLFNETGSVYSHDILTVELEGVWYRVAHTEAQEKLKKTVSDFLG